MSERQHDVELASPGVEPAGPVLLRGFAVRGPGSLGELVRVGPLEKVSFLVGRNNHGKSTILRATQLFAGSGVDNKYVNSLLLPRDAPDYQEGVGTERHLMARLTESNRPAQLGTNPWQQLHRIAVGQKIAQAAAGGGLHVWVPLGPRVGLTVDAERLDVNAWAMALGIRPAAKDLAAWFLRTAGIESRLQQATDPAWARIPAFREIRPAATNGVDDDPDSGVGLIGELQRWQSPDTKDPSHASDEQRFQRLNTLLQDVLEDASARIHIPHNLSAIQVQTVQARRRLNLDELGDGIKQVLMIGAAALRHEHTLVCVEEPEIHLHPGLQRKLIAHLRERTKNQYLIATHSTPMLDARGAAIFHVVHDGTRTVVTASVRVDDLVRVSEDLGHRASDLLQANYVVWVEGPADRLYWRKWLSIIDPELEEGVHYTAMSYGGSLVSDVSMAGGRRVLTADDDAVDDPEHSGERDLVDLLTLGRRCTLIADSDKSKAAAPLSSTLQELQSVAARSETGDLLVLGHVRTVENLLPPEVLQAAVRTAHPRAGAAFAAPTRNYPYAQPFRPLRPAKPAKVRIAREAITMLHDPSQITPGHQAELRALAARIRLANGLKGQSS